MKYRKYLFLVCLFLLSCIYMPSNIAQAEGLDITFRHAGDNFAVPVDLLKAIGYVESRWSQRNGEPSIDGAYGIMGLRENGNCQTLIEASEETNFSLEVLKTDYVANIVGCAAVLKRYADEESENTGKRPNSAVYSWGNVLRRYSGIKDDATAQMYVQEIYNVLQNGVEGVTEDGEIIIINKQEIDFQETKEVFILPKSPDYPPALWVPACSSNYTPSSRTSANIDRIVIHIADGTYTGTIGWFQSCNQCNPSPGCCPCQVSAHYVISKNGDITQMVLEKDIAHHARSFNTRSIGIEHEGRPNDCSFFTNAMYQASAALVRNICDKYGIPKDRTHIIGHNEVDPINRPNDPGPCWDWNKFMQLVNSVPPPCPSTKFNVGNQVRVTGTGGLGLRVRATPSALLINK